MKVGQLVKFEFPQDRTMMGVIIGLDPFDDGLHTEIFWADSEEENGWIISIWCNEDFVIVRKEQEESNGQTHTIKDKKQDYADTRGVIKTTGNTKAGLRQVSRRHRELGAIQATLGLDAIPGNARDT